MKRLKIFAVHLLIFINYPFIVAVLLFLSNNSSNLIYSFM